MMVPFDGAGPPQQGQPGVAPQPIPRPTMPSGHGQTSPSPNMQSHGHHQAMNTYGHRNATNMSGQSIAYMPPSPARQGSFTGSMPASSQYSGHPPLHSPHQPQGGPSPMHPPHQMPPHRPTMSRPHSGMGPSMQMQPQHDVRVAQAVRQQQHMGTSGGSGSGGGLSGNWQSNDDTVHRRDMIQQIVKLLKKDNNGSPDSTNRVPQMAKQLEVSLYRQATSFEAYMDMHTLKKRLQIIAAEVQRNSRRQNDANRTFSDDRRYERPPQQQQHPQHPPPPPPPPPPIPQQQYQNNGMRDNRGGASYSQPNRMVNTADVSSSVNQGGIRQSAADSSFDIRRPTINDSGSTRGTAPGAGAATASSFHVRNDPEWKVRIRHKQQRLLLLHHSAKCLHEDGHCTVTPHCADMKHLWRHMEGCKDNGCRVAHCFSSRAILSHYRKCKDPTCPACGPVRETVRRSKGYRSASSSIQNPAAARGPSSQLQPQPPPPQPPQQQLPDPLLVSNSFNSTTSSMGGSNGSSLQPLRTSGHPPMRSLGAAATGPGGQYSSSQQFQQPSNGVAPSAGSLSSAQPHRQNNSNNDIRVRPLSTSLQNDSAALSFQPVQSSSNAVGSSNGSLPGRQDSEWQKVKHKQQRLLLLRHASRCQHKAGECPVTPHCASMKKLWEHIAHCKNQQCDVQHCLSSRYVLSHYRRCKDANCPACGPVRDTIKKSHERESRTGAFGTTAPAIERLDQSINGSFLSTNSNGSTPPVVYNPQNKKMKTEHITSEPTLLQSAPLAPSPPAVHPPPASPEPSSSLQISAPVIAEVAPSFPVQDVSLPPSSSPIPSASSAPALVRSEQPENIFLTESTVAKLDSKELKPASVDHSLLNSFTIKELETHLASLDRKTQLPPAKLKSKCTEVLKGLQTHNHGWVFNCPVDPVELGLPDYFDIIKKPMDLGTIQKKLETGAYQSMEVFQSDVNLTFDNAMTYNENGSVVFDMAKELKCKFESDMKKLLSQLEVEDGQRRQNERACTLCGCEQLLFEPPVYFCNGMNCQNQRIRRNSNFYVGGNNQYFWCSTCFNELNEKTPIELADITITKADLKKKKNDEVHEESWVQCDTCERWVHQVCGLFNTRQNKEHHSEYCCPKCLYEKQKKGMITPALKPPGASDLPRTMLSEWLEKHIAKRIDRKKRQLAEDKAQTEGIALHEATRQIESGGPIIIRQVTSMDRKLEVRELMRKRYEHKNYPEEFPFRCKCIVVFQHLDGVDVVLFALYVYEHGEDNPPPNKKVVYISYLDSVHFMRPRRLRTFVYHEILIAYLDYARRRGFISAHLWACPPLKGDDYIFYAKPEDQKTPRDSRLRQWYIDMLLECQKRNIVGKVTNMYDLYFANEKIDATSVPYLEGDYFPGEAENIIKMIQEGGGKKSGGGGKKKKNKTSVKNKGSTGTRSTGVDEEALIASGLYDGAKSLKDLDRDQVMVKLGETIQPMKDSFIVAFLNWSGAKEEDMVVPAEIEKARIEYAAKGGDGDITGSKRDAVGNIRDTVAGIDKDGQIIKVIDDDDEDLDCEFLNNRQAFLNLCRGNHYQFDELRRAKHTSMMVLWHMHNRDAPKFVQQCVACNREILSGMRYHCNSCPDYDLCQECYKNPKTNRGSCTHKLQSIAVEPESAKDRSGLSEAERLQRHRNLILHIQLIEHASRCTSNCTSSNCAKMKNYLQHSRTCQVKAAGGCRICKRIWTLLRIHAQKCKDRNCPIPQCIAIREKMRQLQKQQQAMDDRRRLEMNRHRFGSTAGSAQY